jgi:hypothetical protein
MTATAAVVAVGLAIGVPWLLARPAANGAPLSLPASPPVNAAGCPTVANPQPSTSDVPGRLVPTGAVAATLCERTNEVGAAPTPSASPGSAGGHPIRSRTLTSAVDELVAHLNSLPNRAQWAAQQASEGNVSRELVCTLMGFPTDLSVAMRYPDGSTTVVWLDRNCGTASAGGRTRYGTVLDVFLPLYHAQVAAATKPDAIPDPKCPGHLAVDRITTGDLASAPRDELGDYRAGGAAFLAFPIAKVGACRYDRTASGFTLRQGKQVAGSEQIRAVFNAAVPAKTAKDATPSAACMDQPGVRADVIDVVSSVDNAGLTADLLVLRTPCAAVFQLGRGGVVPTPQLLTRLDGWLGPVTR